MRFGTRELVFFVVLLAIPALAFFYVFKPGNERIALAQQEITTKQVKLQRLDDMAEQIDDLGLKIEQALETIEIIDEKLPAEQDVDRILDEVTKIARNNRLNVPSVDTQDVVSAPLYRELPLRITMEGNFDGFYGFLIELENLPRITRIHQMKLGRRTDGTGPTSQRSDDGAMRAEFTLAIYFEPDADREEA